jgi:5-methylcytosine-specific restriction endonuclease McrA
VTGNRTNISSKDGRRIRNSLASKFGARCYICKTPGDIGSFVLEHKIPWSRGGSNRQENLGLACMPCDVHKRDMTIEEYMSVRGTRWVPDKTE